VTSKAPNRSYDRDGHRCLRVEEWPEPDQAAWRSALEPGDIFDQGGAGANWAPNTRRGIIGAYGRWLAWLTLNGLLDGGQGPAERVTPQFITRYVADLQRLNASSSVFTNIVRLWTAMNALAPHDEWKWLGEIAMRLKRLAAPARNKRERLVPVDELFAFGVRLMVEAEAQTDDLPWRQAVKYRDGLQIALLATRPLRIHNFAMIELNRHLIRTSAGFVLRFAAQETKTRRALEFPFPLQLEPYLNAYLSRYRPVLCAHTGREGCPGPSYAGSRLWMSYQGTEMQPVSIYTKITELTESRLGKRLNPHLFRDCAATSIAYEQPENVEIAATILGHATLATTEQYYIHAQSVRAAGHYQEHIVALRGKSALPRSDSTRRRRTGSKRLGAVTASVTAITR
jgi:integrase